MYFTSDVCILRQSVAPHHHQCTVYCVTRTAQPLNSPSPQTTETTDRSCLAVWADQLGSDTQLTWHACVDNCLCLFVSSFFFLSSFLSPALSLGFTILGEIFVRVTVFDPAVEDVTFRLRGWCLLGIILLLAFTGQGHECQNLWSACDGMHVCTD